MSEDVSPLPVSDPRVFHRLSLPPSGRLLVVATGSSFAGVLLGAAKGMKDSEMRFRAENAHRLPNSTTGWYFYHKSKNYNAMLGGIFEGLRMGRRLAGWSCLFSALEASADRGRAMFVRAYREMKGRVAIDDVEEEKHVAGNQDFLSTTAAGIGAAGIFSAWNRFPMATTMRTVKIGMKYGLLLGVAQDMLSVVKGHRLGYVAFVRTQLGMREYEEMEQASTTLTG